jgi:AcrR family transcriptional regulator
MLKPMENRKPVGRPRKADRGGAEARILDAAEALFAGRGFHGVTLREIAISAEVDAALLHYYFEHKRGLFDAVWERRAEVVNRERLQALERYAVAHAGRLTVEGALEAFLLPLLDPQRHRDPGWRHYFTLTALVSNSAEWGGEMMGRCFDPVVRRLIDLIAAALPGADRAELYWSYQMLSGALMLTLSNTGRIDRLSDGRCRSADVEAIAPRMVRYAAAGFRALCEAPPRAHGVAGDGAGFTRRRSRGDD